MAIRRQGPGLVDSQHRRVRTCLYVVVHTLVGLLSVVISPVVTAQTDKTYVLGASAAMDSADSYSVGLLAQYSLTPKTTLLADLGVAQVDADFDTLTNRSWNLAVEKHLRPAGVRVEVGQWGDKQAVTSDRWSVGIFRELPHVRLAVDYVWQNLDVTFRLVQDPTRQSEATVRSTSPTLYASVFSDEGRSVWLSAAYTRYNRPVDRLGQLRFARLLSPSALSLTSTLLDHSVSVGADWPIGENLLSLSLGRDRTVVGSVDVDTLTVGWLTPVGSSTDLDISLGVSRDSMDTQVFLSFALFRYGGID